MTERGYIDHEKIKKEKYQYIDELVTTINEYNDILALWIKMKQGTLSLNIETFDLNELFELLGKGRRAFEMKNQKLEIETTPLPQFTLYIKDTSPEQFIRFLIFLNDSLTIHQSETTTLIFFQNLRISYILHSDDTRVIYFLTDNTSYIFFGNPPSVVFYGNLDIRVHSTGIHFDCSSFRSIFSGVFRQRVNHKQSQCPVSLHHNRGRFYFRLPSGVRKAIGVLLLCLLLPFGVSSCLHDPIPPMLQEGDSIVVVTDSAYEDLLDAASDYANAAYFANVDENYEFALQYIDSAILLLNEHYEKYARPDRPHRYMKLVGEGTPAEISWWNELFDSDYHVILDIRNEAAVAFLALKQLDAYSYNNSAFTDLYKLQGEDQTLEAYCRQLERSNTNKTVGIILCFVLLIVSLVGYYFLYMRKRLQNRLNLEQVLEINQKVFAASLVRPQEQENAEALQREESTLKEIPQRIVDEAFASVNELLTRDAANTF